MSSFWGIWSLICGLLLLINAVKSEDILGCGGFVKSEVEINFSMVEVKLYTKQGSLKYQTDCAPNNGYYMIPVYDKGEYILKVEPPPGWTFEPTSVELNIDGSKDQCSRGEDINFQFTGFGLTGRVVSSGQSEGPKGVKLELTKKGSKDVVKSAETKESGDFVFERVLPGDYLVTAFHESWEFDNYRVEVHVGKETGNAGNALSVLGFDVRGRVFSEGEGVKGVNFVVFSDEKRRDDVTHCDKSPLPDFQLKHGLWEILCFVPSDKDGLFRFPALPNGKFKLVPYYKGEHVAFDIVPAMVEFEVDQNTVIIEEPFQVAGFSVYGKVVNKAGGRGIPDAKISVNGKEMGRSDAEGIYHLYGMKTGHYEISAVAEQLFFDGTKVKITPNTPQLPDLVATRFSLCGQIVIDQLPEGLSYTSPQRQVTLHPKGDPSKLTTLTSDNQGAFCAEVQPGTYVVKVALSDHELKAGLKLAPAEREATVLDEPVSDVIFSQFRATVSGTVTCLEKCGNLQLSLTPVGRTDDRQLTQSTEAPKGAKFSFSDVMPGQYKVSLLHEEWCWKEKTADIEVTDKDVTDVAFVQSGYILSCSLSHDIRLNFAQENKPGNVGSFSLTKGVNKFCLAQPGVYKLTLDSCHQFEQDIYRYDTANPSVLTLTAVKHRVEGTIVAAESKNDVVVNIKSFAAGEKPVDLGPLKAEPNKDEKKAPGQKFVYRFHYWAKSGEKLHIKPRSGELLFYPGHIDATIVGDTCPGEVAQFEAKMGIFLSGKTEPPLKGVKITVSVTEEKDNVLLTVETNDKGTYRVGPLDSDKKYSVEAEKEGYVLTASSGGSFKAFKLGEIVVKVFDEKQQPLAGALLSLSGGNYRSNKVTSNNGVMNFLGLGPGQYFLRPMMKEYKFEPQSQMIDVLEGATINVQVKSTRVAYSCYGKVTSLNGEAEPAVVLEAVSRDSAGCENLQEETKTEQDGSFRIRGLQPNCDYDIKLKTGEVNQHIERASPKTTLVKVTDTDAADVNIIAFRRMNQLDLSGNVITAPEFLSSIKISLFRETNLDSPIHTISLTSTSFFYLPSLTIDNQNYVVKLTSNLPKSSYEFKSEELTFVANTSHHHFTFQFKPKMKSLDQELSQGSFLILPITIIIGLLIYNYQKVLPMLSQGFENLQNLLQKSSVTSSASSRDSASQPMIDADLLSTGDTTTGKKKKVRKT